MHDLSPAAQAAWRIVKAGEARFFETVAPEGCRELVALGWLEEVQRSDDVSSDRHSFTLTAAGRAQKHHDLLVSSEASHAANEREVREAVEGA